MKNGDRQRVANVLEAARLQSLAELEASFGPGKKPDRLDVLIVAQWYDGALGGQTRGPMELLKAHGPTLGVGTGLGAILVAVIEAVGRVLGG